MPLAGCGMPGYETSSSCCAVTEARRRPCRRGLEASEAWYFLVGWDRRSWPRSCGSRRWGWPATPPGHCRACPTRWQNTCQPVWPWCRASEVSFRACWPKAVSEWTIRPAMPRCSRRGGCRGETIRSVSESVGATRSGFLRAGFASRSSTRKWSGTWKRWAVHELDALLCAPPRRHAREPNECAARLRHEAVAPRPSQVLPGRPSAPALCRVVGVPPLVDFKQSRLRSPSRSAERSGRASIDDLSPLLQVPLHGEGRLADCSHVDGGGPPGRASRDKRHPRRRGVAASRG